MCTAAFALYVCTDGHLFGQAVGLTSYYALCTHVKTVATAGVKCFVECTCGMYGCAACRLLNSCRGSQNLESLARRCHNLQLSLKKRSSPANPISDHHRLQAIISMHLVLCQLDTDCSNCMKTSSKTMPLPLWARPIEDLGNTACVLYSQPATCRETILPLCALFAYTCRIHCLQFVRLHDVSLCKGTVQGGVHGPRL